MQMKTFFKTGLIQTVAGTGGAGWSGDGALASSACLNEPKSLTIDPEGNLFIADSENHVIRGRRHQEKPEDRKGHLQESRRTATLDREGTGSPMNPSLEAELRAERLI